MYHNTAVQACMISMTQQELHTHARAGKNASEFVTKSAHALLINVTSRFKAIQYHTVTSHNT